jgi:hypothetical protein
MARPHEPHADALRIAHQIVDEAGARLAQAVREADAPAIADARHDLAVRIAQAIADAEHAAERARGGEALPAGGAEGASAHLRSWPATLFGVPAWGSLGDRAGEGEGWRDGQPR